MQICWAVVKKAAKTKSVINPMDNLEFNEIVTTKRLFKCPFCSYTSEWKMNVELHRKSHNLVRRFQCLECETVFNTKSSLVSHQKSHLDTKLFKCAYCNYTHKLKKSLTLHQRTHFNSEKGLLSNNSNMPFECDVCHLYFKLKLDLTHHHINTHSMQHLPRFTYSRRLKTGSINPEEMEDSILPSNANNNETNLQESNEENNVIGLNLEKCEVERNSNSVKVVNVSRPVELIRADKSVEVIKADESVEVIIAGGPVEVITAYRPVELITADGPVEVITADSLVEVITADSPVEVITADGPVNGDGNGIPPKVERTLCTVKLEEPDYPIEVEGSNQSVQVEGTGSFIEVPGSETTLDLEDFPVNLVGTGSSDNVEGTGLPPDAEVNRTGDRSTKPLFKSFPCHLCSKTFGLRCNLEVHLRSHRLFNCPLCKFTFKRKGAFDRHVNQHNSLNELKHSPVNVVEKTKQKTNGSNYKCSVCNYTSTVKKQLILHQRHHDRNSPKIHIPWKKSYECKVCLKRFSSEIDFTRHSCNNRASLVLQRLAYSHGSNLPLIDYEGGTDKTNPNDVRSTNVINSSFQRVENLEQDRALELSLAITSLKSEYSTTLNSESFDSVAVKQEPLEFDDEFIIS